MKKLFFMFFMFLCCITVSAQNIKINGKVTDASSNLPVEGVTVKVKGLSAVVRTDNAGQYAVSVPSRNATLVFSHVNYVQREVPIGQSNTLNIALQSKIVQADEVVIIGYGTVKKKDVTGSVAKVNMQDINKAPVASLDQALAGRVAGVQVNALDGQPGSAMNIIVRGANSVSQSNAPLYVVDGFPIEDMNLSTINMSDVESIEILKDASATAIYGARGANGVVMVTTKRGKSGAPTVKVNSYYGWQQNIKEMKIFTPYDYVKYVIEVNPSTVSSTPPPPSILYLGGGTTLDYYKTARAMDYQSQIFQTAPMLSNSLSITGGNDKTKYAISGNIFDQKGMIITSRFKRYQGRVVLDQKINNKLKVGLNANYSYLKQSGLNVGGSNFSGTLNLMYSVWGFRPVNPSPASMAALNGVDFDIDEDTNTDPLIGSANDYRFNPFKSLKNTLNDNLTKTLLTNGYLEYSIMPNLVLKVTGGIDDRIVTAQKFFSSQTAQGSLGSVGGSPNGSIYNNYTTSLLNENYLTYTKTISQDHDLTAMVGMSNQRNKTSVRGFEANQVPNEVLGINAIGQGMPTKSVTAASSNTSVSLLGRVNYGYKSKYLLTASYRADASSKFAPENRWAYFPSGAIAWRISKEKFMDKLRNVISDAKLKATYGVTGNNRVDDFAYLSVYKMDPFFGYTMSNLQVSGAFPSTIGNTKLKWETTGQADLGLELGFFKDRINLEVDAYRKITSNLLLDANVPTSSGYPTVYKNIGKVKNQGLEIAVNSTNIKTKNFTWTSAFNISFNQNKVLELAENQEAIGKNTPWSTEFRSLPSYIVKVGQPMGLMYGLIADGLYQAGDFDVNTSGAYILKDEITSNGNSNRANIQPGDIKYKDLNGDKTIDKNDYTVIGHSLPKHIGGFTNNFAYKGFDLNVFFQWSYGNDIQNMNNYVFRGGNTGVNQYESYIDRWSPSNTDTKLVRAGGFRNTPAAYSTYTIEDGSYLRLKTLSFGYNFPAKVLKPLNVKGVRAYSSVQNVITWTKYSGQDPEVSLYNSVLTGGFDYSSYPKARTFTLGLDVTF